MPLIEYKEAFKELSPSMPVVVDALEAFIEKFADSCGKRPIWDPYGWSAPVWSEEDRCYWCGAWFRLGAEQSTHEVENESDAPWTWAGMYAFWQYHDELPDEEHHKQEDQGKQKGQDEHIIVRYSDKSGYTAGIEFCVGRKKDMDKSCVFSFKEFSDYLDENKFPYLMKALNDYFGKTIFVEKSIDHEGI